MSRETKIESALYEPNKQIRVRIETMIDPNKMASLDRYGLLGNTKRQVYVAFGRRKERIDFDGQSEFTNNSGVWDLRVGALHT